MISSYKYPQAFISLPTSTALIILLSSSPDHPASASRHCRPTNTARILLPQAPMFCIVHSFTSFWSLTKYHIINEVLSYFSVLNNCPSLHIASTTLLCFSFFALFQLQKEVPHIGNNLLESPVVSLNHSCITESHLLAIRDIKLSKPVYGRLMNKS